MVHRKMSSTAAAAPTLAHSKVRTHLDRRRWPRNDVRKQSLNAGRSLRLTGIFSQPLRGVGEHGGIRHPLRAKITVRGVLQGRFAQIHIQQFHAHERVNNFVEFPACHFRHRFSPGRAQFALAPVRAGRSLSSKIDRARFSLDRTVPTGHSNRTAASL